MKLQHVTGKDDLRISMTYVCIDDKNAVATDAHSLVIIPKEYLIMDGGEPLPEMYIKGTDWAKLAKGDFYLMMEGVHLVSVKQKDFSEIARVKPLMKDDADFQYPKIYAVIPSESTYAIPEIGVSLPIIKNLISALPNISCGYKVSFYGANKAIIFKPQDDSEFEGLIGLMIPSMIH